ncbi:MAG: NUDIX domain-containing protein [Micropepsaceae bacterium]
MSHLCVGALILDGQRILLGLRAAHKSYPHRWDIPGGHVECGETLDQALIRELQEELDITPVRWTHDARHMQGDTELHLFRVTAWSGTPRLCGDEHDELRWCHLSEAASLPNLAAAEYSDIFRALLAKPDPRT